MNRSITIKLLAMVLVACLAGGVLFLISRDSHNPPPPEPAPQLAGDLPAAIQWDEPADSVPDNGQEPPLEGGAETDWIESGSVASIPLLIRHLKDDDELVQLAALQEFAGMGAKARRAAPAILEALKCPKGRVRIEAAVTLIQMDLQSSAAISALIGELRGEDADVRARAAAAIAELIDPPAPFFSCWGPDPPPQIARPWVGRRTLPGLQQAAGDPDPNVAAAAANAIRKLDRFAAAKRPTK